MSDYYLSEATKLEVYKYTEAIVLLDKTLGAPDVLEMTDKYCTKTIPQ